MAKRLQVILQDVDYRQIQRAARARHLSIAEWVRQALDAARKRAPDGNGDRKVEAIRSAAQHEFPTGDIEEMLSEIERGYRAGMP